MLPAGALRPLEYTGISDVLLVVLLIVGVGAELDGLGAVLAAGVGVNVMLLICDVGYCRRMLPTRNCTDVWSPPSYFPVMVCPSFNIRTSPEAIQGMPHRSNHERINLQLFMFVPLSILAMRLWLPIFQSLSGNAIRLQCQ